MKSNEAIIRKLYDSFQAGDAKGMASCYHKDATFSDKVFPHLEGADIGTMWAMLVAAAKGLEITYGGVTADANSGSVHWEAKYKFGAKGRLVHNKIHTNFAFKDGKIHRQVDSFSFWRWSRQALGPVGWLLGWTPLVRAQVRKDAARRLANFKPSR